MNFLKSFFHVGLRVVFIGAVLTASAAKAQVIPSSPRNEGAPETPSVQDTAHKTISPIPGGTLAWLGGDAGCIQPPVIDLEWEVDPALGQPDAWWITVSPNQEVDGTPGLPSIYSSGTLPGAGRSHAFTHQATTDSTFYITLWWKWGGRWQFTTEAYRTAGLPGIGAPALEASLPQTGEFILKPNGTAVVAWWLWLGREKQSSDYFAGGVNVVTPSRETPSRLNYELTNIPAGDPVIQATLFWRVEGEDKEFWHCRELTYNFLRDVAMPSAEVNESEGIGNGGAGRVEGSDDLVGKEHLLVEPKARDTLGAKIQAGCYLFEPQTFRWDLAEGSPTPSAWWLTIATTRGAGRENADVYNSGFLDGSLRSHAVPNIPTSGRPLYATLWWLEDAATWRFTQNEYRTEAIPTIFSPEPGTALSSTEGNFELRSHGAALKAWWLWLGDSPQTNDYLSEGFEVDPQNVDSKIAYSNLPADGRVVHATLFWRVGLDEWRCREFLYRASKTTPGEVAPEISVSAALTDIVDGDSPSHAFQVAYEGLHELDTASLGDDDVVLIRDGNVPTLQPEPVQARLESFESANGGRQVIATYVFNRPESGWKSLGERLDVSLVGGAVESVGGIAAQSTKLGAITVRLADSLAVNAVVVGFPRLDSRDDRFIDVAVRYTANVPLDRALFGSGELRVDLPFAPDKRYVVEEAHALVSLLQVELDKGDVSALAVYRVEAPASGWGLGIRAAIAFSPAKLGQRDGLAWRGIGSIALEEPTDFTGTIVADPIDEPVTSHPFQVVFEQRSGPLDVVWLEGAAVRLGYAWAPGANGAVACSIADWLGMEISQDGHRALVSLRIARPAEGWNQLGLRSIAARLVSRTVQTSKGSKYGPLGSIPFAYTQAIAPHQKAFEDWVRGLESSLGLEPGATPEPEGDSDGDGMKDLVEFAMGTDPLHAGERSPIETRLVTEEKENYVELVFNQRLHVGGLVWRIEGSEDGLEWLPFDDSFELIYSERISGEVERLTLRSRRLLGELGAQLFRVAIEGVDQVN